MKTVCSVTRRPVAANGDDLEVKAAFTRAFRERQNRNSLFVNLPFKSLDKIRLKEKLGEIDRIRAVESVVRF